MFTLLVGALAILGTQVVLAAALVGIGLSVRRALGPREHGLDEVLRAFWVGLGAVVGFLLLWNAVLPIGDAALGIVLVAGICGLVGARGGLRRGLTAEPWRPGLGFALAALAVSLWLAELASAPAATWDDSLYHLQAVEWAKRFPVVPGIANLHGPLAFNNASFLYAALIDGGPWRGGGFHVACGLLLLVTALQALVGAARLASGARTVLDVYSCMLLAPALYWALEGRIASYDTDLPAATALLAATGAMLAWFGDRRGDEREQTCALVSIAVLLSTIVCFKISLGVVSAGAMLVVLGFARRRLRGARAAWSLGAAVAVVALFAAAWTTRGVVQSGYPLFPMTVVPFDVDWRAPQEHGLAEVANISYTEHEFSWTIGHAWLRRVLILDPYAVLIPALLAALGLAGLGLALRRRGRTRFPVEAWALPPLAAAVVAWFATVPSTRYGTALFWALAAASCGLAVLALGVLDSRRGRLRLLAAGLALGLSPPLVHPLLGALGKGLPPLPALLAANFVEPPASGWFHGVATQSPWRSFTTDSGLELNVPEQRPRGAQGGAGGKVVRARPWNTPLPCTPNPDPHLSLREPGRLERGFRVDGSWAMQDFPYPWRSEFLPEWRARRAGESAETPSTPGAPSPR